MRRFAWILIALVACFDSAGPGMVQLDTNSADTATQNDSKTITDAVTHSDVQKLNRSILGKWYDCIGTMEFKADNTFMYQGLDANCTTTGTYKFQDFILDLTVTNTTCPTDKSSREADFLLKNVVVNIAASMMQWTNPDLDNSTKLWLRGNDFTAEKWLLYDPSHKQGQDIRACFTKEHKFVQGFYFSIANMDGLLSGSGRVERVEPVKDKPETWQVRTTCRGTCFCAGILELAISNARINGTYRTMDCGKNTGPLPVEGDQVQWSGYME